MRPQTRAEMRNCVTCLGVFPQKPQTSEVLLSGLQRFPICAARHRNPLSGLLAAMPRLSSALDRANTILRAHGTPYRLREGHGSRWLSVYENQPGRKARERAARGYASREDQLSRPFVHTCWSWPKQTPSPHWMNYCKTSALKPSPPPAATPAGRRSARRWWRFNGARG